ncbi:hypothetical protein ACIRJS_45420 [Streptomyces sp. NPDC102340]|uniref:hypothetical protein n=1 Tax=unclassified Streptomyces TaxID=2593676 RepID=UPI003805D625
MKVTVALPLSKVAFDDPGTRRAYERARKRAVVNLSIRGVVWLGLLLVATLGPDDDSQLVRGFGSFTFMVWSFFLIGPAKAVRWYLAVGQVLKSGPWQYGVAVRRPDVKVGAGTAVEVRIGLSGEVADSTGAAGQATGKVATPVFAARTWRRRRRWVQDLEEGAWFVGDPERVGVIALPGGHEFMTLQRPERVG